MLLPITDEFMLQMRAKAKEYSFVTLKRGPNIDRPDARAVIWEHGRRNHALRLSGVLSIVCPMTDEGEVVGIGIFNCTITECQVLMDEDPCVREGIFVYEVHPCRGFPGDSLPE
jgi:hypothetical protein